MDKRSHAWIDVIERSQRVIINLGKMWEKVSITISVLFYCHRHDCNAPSVRMCRSVLLVVFVILGPSFTIGDNGGCCPLIKRSSFVFQQ